MSAEQTQKLAKMVQRAAQCMPDYYATWHKDAREVLANLDSPPAPPQPVQVRQAIQISTTFDSLHGEVHIYAVCSDGTILQALAENGNAPKSWVQMPPILQPGE